jgi:hypothetical protein
MASQSALYNGLQWNLRSGMEFETSHGFMLVQSLPSAQYFHFMQFDTVLSHDSIDCCNKEVAPFGKIPVESE